MSMPNEVTVVDVPMATVIPDPMPPAPVAPPATMLGMLMAMAQDMFTRYKAWMTSQPAYVHMIAIVLATILGSFITKYIPELAPFLPSPASVAKAPPPAAAEAQPALVEAVVATEKIGEGHRFVAGHIRRRVEHQLNKDWLKSVNGPEKPPADTTANTFASKLSDQVIVDALSQAGALDKAGDGDRPVLGFIQKVAQWIKDHPEEFQAIIKILLMLLMAFGDQVAWMMLDLDQGGAELLVMIMMACGDSIDY